MFCRAENFKIVRFFKVSFEIGDVWECLSKFLCERTVVKLMSGLYFDNPNCLKTALS